MSGHPGWTGKRRRREWVLSLAGTPSIMAACRKATEQCDQRRLPADNRRARLRAKRARRACHVVYPPDACSGLCRGGGVREWRIYLDSLIPNARWGSPPEYFESRKG